MLQDSGMWLVPTPDEPPALSFRENRQAMVFWIGNLETLATVHDSIVIDALYEEIDRRLTKKIPSDAFQVVRSSKDIPVNSFDENASDDHSQALALGAILADISSKAISVHGARIHVALMGALGSSACRSSGPGDHGSAAACQTSSERLPNGGPPSSSFLCSAARLVADFFEAVTEGRITLAYRPVCKASGEDVLHYECVPQVQACDGHVQSEAELRPAMERLGLARAFDRLIASIVVEELFGDPSIHLAVTISVASASDDAWWAELWIGLAQRPDVASRLIVIIAGANGTVHLSSTCRFISRLRKLGCFVGIGGFGIGSSLNHVLALQPDMVEIDPFFLSPVARQQLGMRCLEHVAAVAGGGGRTVVAAGVRDKFDLIRVKTAGISWWQGQYSGRPASIRPWKMRSSHLDDQRQRDGSSNQATPPHSDGNGTSDMLS